MTYDQPETPGAAQLDSVRFDEHSGLIPAVVQDAADGTVLMLAWMDREALRRTLSSGRVTYWSRSRQEYWRKGDTSGNVQHLVQARVDCDRDVVLLQVEQTGPACHTGTRSCFDDHAAHSRRLRQNENERA